MRRLILSLSLMACAALGACDKKQDAADPAAAEANAAEGEAFLAKNAKEPGVVTTPTGLQYKIVRSGSADGPKPRLHDEVKVHYEGKLLNGEVFDSSYEQGVPVVFTPDSLVPAWTEALQMMRPGDEWELFVPAKLGYGDRDMGAIPPGSTLIFKLELLGVHPVG